MGNIEVSELPHYAPGKTISTGGRLDYGRPGWDTERWLYLDARIKAQDEARAAVMARGEATEADPEVPEPPEFCTDMDDYGGKLERHYKEHRPGHGKGAGH